MSGCGQEDHQPHRGNYPLRPSGLPSTSSILRDGKSHRDAGKPTDRPQPRHAASRAIALDVRVALGGELLDCGTQRVHGRSIRSSATIEEIGAAAATPHAASVYAL